MRILNRKAKFEYEIKGQLEAGIVLTGAEVKSVRSQGVDMSNAFCKIMPNKFGAREMWVFNMVISPYSHADNTNYDPAKKRKLLLHQREIVAIETKMKQQRLLLVPTAVYTNSGKIKVELGLARGKRIYEKREAIKKRDLDREMQG